MDSLNWKEVAPGRYERAIDESEEVYVLVAAAAAPLNKEHWSLTAAIKVDQFTTDFVNEVQQAWKTFRHDHPSVATFIEDGKRVYNVAKQDSSTVGSRRPLWSRLQVQQCFIVVYDR